MSNVIKAYTVRYDEETKKTIDNQMKIKQVLPLLKPTTVTATLNEGEFVEGLKVMVVDAPPQEEIAEKSVRLLEEAKKEAKSILEQAGREAEQLKKDAQAAAQKQGYNDGIAKANKEIHKQREELVKQAEQQVREYEAMVRSMEPQIVELIASLVEKITGIVVSDREEVIYYLVSKAILNMDKSNEYTVKVSTEDFEYVASRKQLLLEAIGREVGLYILEDATLEKNQCLIETELRVINCSLDVQLANLISDLKLLGGI